MTRRPRRVTRAGLVVKTRLFVSSWVRMFGADYLHIPFWGLRERQIKVAAPVRI